MVLIRATLFNLLFYGLTALACILCLPSLLLPREKAINWIVRNFVRSVYFLEKYVLGLDFEIRGLHRIPKQGAFIIAAKHESAYETMKLHLLFDDPAIVLKKELLRIPLWGQFLAKIDPIAIDRSKGKSAMQQIMEGAQHVARQHRPLIIFPQGTRVGIQTTTKEKPYKIGVVRMAEATNMPIIPLALNTGCFWPKNSWVKKPGKVVFEFLPPIDRQSLGPYEIVKDLEQKIESHSQALAAEAGCLPLEAAAHKAPETSDKA